MGRNRRGKGRGKNGGGRQPPKPPAPPPKTKADEIGEAHDRAFEVANEEDLAKVEPRPAPSNTAADELWQKVDEAEQLFRVAATRLEAERGELEKKAAELATRDEDLGKAEAEVAEREQAAEARAAEHAAAKKEAAKTLRDAEKTTKELLERERTVAEAEAEAEAGFAERNREATRKLAEQVQALTEQHDALQRTMADAAAAQALTSDQVWSKAREEAEAAIEQERAALREERDKLLGLRREVENERQKLTWEKADLQDERTLLGERAEQIAASELAQRDSRIDVLSAQVEVLKTERDDLEQRVREHEARARRFEHRTDEEIDEQIEGLKSQVKDLKEKLARLPSEASAEEAAQLRARCDALASDLANTRRELEDARLQLSRTEVGVSELEALRDQSHSYKKSNELLQAANEQLRRDIDARIRSSDGSSPFPACAAIDGDRKLQGRRPVADDVDLEELVDRTRRGAATAKNPLYYTPEDTRAFLGGMAMSRLALLQGPSGTGKTSLPFAFANAMGTVVELVPAEAGWHDPADLLGHFNQFERRFDERPFLQALYRAGTPFFADVPVFVVVDEMNLSHPEQYFSNVIAMLEAERLDTQYFELLPTAADGAPAQLKDGRKLALPENVWFIGTANHDETTKDFADKTYDRAVVMELPITPVKFDADSPWARDAPVGLQALETAFERAARRHASEVERGMAFLQEHLREPLARRFRSGWSPRLHRQAQRFIPAVIDAGGSLGEALDHLAAMRILRKIRHRHSTRADDLDVLTDIFDKKWRVGIDGRSAAPHCIELLEAERSRLERDLL